MQGGKQLPGVQVSLLNSKHMVKESNFCLLTIVLLVARPPVTLGIKKYWYLSGALSFKLDLDPKENQKS